MRILALVTDAFGGTGGIAQYNRDLCRALAQGSGNEIVVLPRLGEVDGASLPAGVHQLKARGRRLGYALGALRTALSRGPFDCVFCGHLHLSPLAALVARFLRIPLWLQLHGSEAWEKTDWSRRSAAERASLITAVSRHTRTRFLAVSGVDPSLVRVLPPTFDACFSPGPKTDHLLDRYGVRGKLVLLTVGRMDPNERGKGHDRVIRLLPEIVPAFPNLVYLVVGGGEDRTRLQSLARSSGMENHVLFVGGVGPGELPQLYRLADLFVMPSTQEGFGIVFLEAAASGVYAIGGNADGSADALADGAVGSIVDPSDAAALAAAIKMGLRGERGGADPADVRRFAFADFAGHVRELTSRYLLGSAEAIAR
jgi:phosphatidyl-myo-inositol dimannoside synthase